MSSGDTTPQFTRVDWDDVEASQSKVQLSRVITALGIGGLVLLVVGTDLQVNDLGFVLGVATVLFLGVGVVPMVRYRTTVWRLIKRTKFSLWTILAAGYLAVVVIAGSIGAYRLSYSMRPSDALQPPVGFTSEFASSCVGETRDLTCYGSLEYPLGTNHRGHALEYLLIEGAQIAVYVLLFTIVFVVPLAVGVGVIAGLRGGRVDEFLMTYVDVQLCLPAILIYFVGVMYWGPSLLLLLVTFGLLSWGGIARLVRSEVIQRRNAGYIQVARTLGGSDRYIIRRHLLPNVSNTILPAVFHILALLVLVEAGISFLGFHDIETYSWGAIISEALNAQVASELQPRLRYPAHEVWWISTLPAIALTLTVVSLKLLGDGIRDMLDPRGDQ